VIHELTIQEFRPGRAADAARIAGTAEAAIRGDAHGVLAGCWISEIGALNRMLTLRSFESPDARAAALAGLGALPRWQAECRAPVLDLLLGEDAQLLACVAGPHAPPAGGVYELRHYALKPGGLDAWLALFLAALPARTRHSPVVGVFRPLAGPADQVWHLWSYPGLDARLRARDAAAADPDWKAFLARSREQGLVQRMANAILLPAPHSPLR
jgi:hypothetical protein